MQRSIDRARRGRRRVAAIGTGALLAAASLVSATPAHAATTTTVHGTVRSGATALVGVPVGFWSRTGHTLAGATTGTGGAFTLRVPSGVRGFAYAGPRPDAARAIFPLRGGSYIRGVIGATQATGTSYRIYQGHASATAAGLARGATLRFVLQQPGRIEVDGGKYLAGTGSDGGTTQVLRLNGAPFLKNAANSTTGVTTSAQLVPGHYKLRYFPRPPYLGRTVPVTVPAGRTTVLSPTLVAGATVRGRLATADGHPAVGVRVVAVRPGVSREDTTDDQGRYSISALPAGGYDLRVGYNAQPDPNAEEGPEDPGAVPPVTSDDYLPATVPFTVGAEHATVPKDVTVAPAGHLNGTVTGAASARVWLEDAGHHLIRTARVASPSGAYALGGLRPGTRYTAYALTGDETPARYGSVTFTATSGTLTRTIAINRPGLTVRGHVANAPLGSVDLVAQSPVWPRLAAVGTIRASGDYVVNGLLPGVYRVQVWAADSANRVPSRPATLTLTASTSRDYAAGPKAGRYTVRFLSGAAPAQRILADAVDGSGDIADFSTRGTNGRATAAGLHPGTYRYVPSSFRSTGFWDAPAADGPWWFGALSSTFAITAGHTTDDGTIALHVHAR